MTATLSAPSAADALPVVEARAVAIAGNTRVVKLQFEFASTSPDSVQRLIDALDRSSIVTCVECHRRVNGELIVHLNPGYPREHLIRHLKRAHADVIRLQDRSR